MAKIPVVVSRYGYQAARIAAYLKRETVYATCRNIWEWVYAHIAYKKDETGYEQLRTPARAFHDRKRGVDCDCYTIFISSILQNLAIPHLLRISKNDQDYFQHIYPVALGPDGREIIMDCVVSAFDFEAPKKEKRDYQMDLQILSGLNESNPPSLYGGLMGELGKLLQKKGSKAGKPAPGVMPGATAKKKILFPKKQVKNTGATPTLPAGRKQKGKLLNKINKVNPGTVMIRNGILASMKLNISNVAARLRWSYLNPAQAQQNGIDLDKFNRLVTVRRKLEDIFFKAGGKPENLKQAILKGKGNTDRAVNGLYGFDEEVVYLNEYYPLRDLLGYAMYHSENVEGMEGFGQLGEPVTLATIAAASGVIAGIVGMLKQVGDIFSGRKKGNGDFDSPKNEQVENQAPMPSAIPAPQNIPEYIPGFPPGEEKPKNDWMTVPQTRSEIPQAAPSAPPPAIPNYPVLPGETFLPDNYALPQGNVAAQKTETTEDVYLPPVPVDKTTNNITDSETGKKTGEDQDGFWAKNKGWVIPAGIGLIGLTVIALIATAQKKNQHQPMPVRPLAGVPGQKKKHRRKSKKIKATVLL